MSTLALFVWTLRDVVSAVWLCVIALLLAFVGVCALLDRVERWWKGGRK